jgi:hypothetical protein
MFQRNPFNESPFPRVKDIKDVKDKISFQLVNSPRRIHHLLDNVMLKIISPLRCLTDFHWNKLRGGDYMATDRLTSRPYAVEELWRLLL